MFEWWKEGGRTSQRACMNDPWSWTTVWGLWEWGMGLVGEGRVGNIGTTVIE